MPSGPGEELPASLIAFFMSLRVGAQEALSVGSACRGRFVARKEVVFWRVGVLVVVGLVEAGTTK